MNFITGNIIATDSNGVIFTSKLESAVYGDASGNVSVMSTMETIIKDDIPSGQTWSITPVGAANRFSYSTIRAGTTLDIKWAVSTQVTSLSGHEDAKYNEDNTGSGSYHEMSIHINSDKEKVSGFKT